MKFLKEHPESSSLISELIRIIFSYFPDGLSEMSKVYGHTNIFWKTEKNERCSELLEMAITIIQKKYVTLFWTVSSPQNITPSLKCSE